MKEKIIPYLKKNALLLSILTVGILILVALILNLTQGGFWIISGMNGKNAYELAVENGFKGTRQEWLDSLVGTNGVNGLNGSDGTNGKSAYEIACDNGFVGSVEEWLLSLQFGEKGEDGKDGVNGINGKDGKNGRDGADGKDGLGIASAHINDRGRLIITLSNGETIDAGYVGGFVGDFKNDYELAVEAGYEKSLHQWLCSYHDGSRTGVWVTDVQYNQMGELIVTLNDGTQLNAGTAAQDDFESDPSDALQFTPRFEMVVLNDSTNSLNLRATPDVVNGAIVTTVSNGSSGNAELVCIGAGTVDGDLFYRFCHNGVICYAKAKFFHPKYDLTAS